LTTDAALVAEEPAAAECSPAAPERRSAVPPATTRPGQQSVVTGLPGGTQNLVDEALAAALIADASHQDFEFVIVAVHARYPRYLGSLVPKRGLKMRAFCLRVALCPDRRPAES
jgi:hypothetical protein